MAHREVLFPQKAAQGMSFSPRYSTVVVQAGAGFETRNSEWSRALDIYDISCTLKDKPAIDEMLRFLRAVCKGSAYSFDFRNPADLSAGIDLSSGAESSHEFAEGDGSETDFQIYKVYTYGAFEERRPIQRPITAIKVYLDGVAQVVTTDYTVNYSTGVITFVSPPALGVDIGWSGEFYTPVRWLEDRVNMVLEGANSAILGGALTEVRI